MAEEGKGEAGEITAASGAPDDDVRVVAGHLHLFHGFLADHRLVQQNVVEHAAEGIFGVVVLRRDLDRLGNGDAETAG